MENFNRILEVTAAVISYYKEHPFEPTKEDCTVTLPKNRTAIKATKV